MSIVAEGIANDSIIAIRFCNSRRWIWAGMGVIAQTLDAVEKLVCAILLRK